MIWSLLGCELGRWEKWGRWGVSSAVSASKTITNNVPMPPSFLNPNPLYLFSPFWFFSFFGWNPVQFQDNRTPRIFFGFMFLWIRFCCVFPAFSCQANECIGELPFLSFLMQIIFFSPPRCIFFGNRRSLFGN